MKIIKVGRDLYNDVVINDPYVGRSMHCQLIVDDYGNVKIVDCSKNGTYVNGVRIGRGREIQLNQLDVVRIGTTTLPWQTYVGGFSGVQQAAPTPPVNNAGGGYANSAYNRVPPPQQKPDNFLFWSICSIFCCCLPLGIVSTVFASRVNGLWRRGDYAGAEEAADMARTWFWWAFGIGLFINFGAGFFYYAYIVALLGAFL